MRGVGTGHVTLWGGYCWHHLVSVIVTGEGDEGRKFGREEGKEKGGREEGRKG